MTVDMLLLFMKFMLFLTSHREGCIYISNTLWKNYCNANYSDLIQEMFSLSYYFLNYSSNVVAKTSTVDVQNTLLNT